MTFGRDKNQAVGGPAEKPYTVAVIENLQVRLRILEPKNLANNERENVWYSDPENVIVHFLPALHDTRFGYAGQDGQTLLCQVINLPEAAEQWEGEFFRSSGYVGTVTEFNVQMSGTVRLYADESGTYGALELTSLEPSEVETPAKLQPGVYTEKFPVRGRTQIHFIDKDSLEITYKSYYTSETFVKCRYEMLDNYRIRYIENGVASEGGGYFRMVSDSTFETDFFYAIVADGRPIPIMTFEKENNQHANE
jgi:hypothetical protein